MSSISPDDPADDNPSAVLVDTITNSSAWIRQRSIFSFGNEEMDPIYFLVAEPGEIVLDPNQPNRVIEVGKLTTNRYQRQGSRIGESWGNHSFTSNFNGQAPVVFSQIQPDPGRTYFVTSTVQNVSSAGFQYALEFGRQSLPNTSNQRTRTFGYIAAPVFSGTTSDGFNFEFGRPLRTYAQASNSDSAFEASCRNNTVPFKQDYDHYAPIIRKQVRNGGDGGWIRVCDVSQDDKVSIIIEEDASNRSHPVGETVAYAVFDQELSRGRDVCEVFTGPAQSWTNQSKLKMVGSTRIFGAANALVGFGNVDSYSNPPTSCDTGICTVDTSLITPRPPFDNLVPSGPSRTFNGSGSVDFPEGSYTSVTIGGNRTVNFTGSNYEIGRLEISGSATINLSRGTLILANDIDIGGNPSINVPGNNPGNLILWAIPQERGGDAEVDIGSGITLYSYIFSADEVELSGSSHIFGSITTKHLDMSGSARLTHTTGECLPSESDVSLSVSPLRQVALMCGDDTPKISVTTSSDDGGISKGFSVEFNNASDSSLFSITSDSGTFPNFTTDTFGAAELTVNVTDIDNIELDKNYQITVTLDSDTSQNETATFKFVPFTFKSTESNNILDVIAGKPTSVTAQVLACDDESSTVAINYEGTPSITHRVELPTPSNGGTIGTLDYEPVFTPQENGRTTDFLTVSESGEFTVSLKDQFECTGYDGCPSDNQYEVEGSITVKSRPWTFAVCPTQSNTNGNSIDANSDSFIAAREVFNLQVKPIRWDGALDGVVDGESKRERQRDANVDFCSGFVTKNFFKVGVDASVTLTHTIATPEQGSTGSVLTGQTIDNISGSDVLEFTNIQIDEVGSFHFAVNATSSFYDYVKEGIEQGARELGRFYPKYFQVIDQGWSYAGTQTFNYMNQNFEQVSFDAEALSKEMSINGGAKEPQPVHNYQYFDRKLKTSFSLYESKLSTRLISPSFGDGAWSGTNQSVGRFSVDLSGECGGNISFCLTKADTEIEYEDGPYNFNEGTSGDTTDIRLAVEDNVDPVEFWNDGDQLLKEPDIRFGRIDLDDVGGNSDTTIAIPLRAEYWDSSRKRFVLNDDDSTTRVDASTSASDVIWSEDGSLTTKVTLANGGQVSDGESRNLKASQGESVSIREQVQLWQSMDDTPWLRYNWDSDKVSDVNGEQDPSTVVTFGIYRGNDRVIYRGESGLTGQ
ncbi:hypothetical protein BCT46_06790 [Vibrio sp. 10N.261.46.E8]|nr:hypothetical protein BH584_08690 [Vibrio sp. 10N.261.45.E1]PMJ23421.1 hypothetical protein BCU27_01515 [Vibrio sp. 10N.286.45.B6]PML87523.1 hypothetical protein BCT66_12140 [Vibrio sp. 10N.261.49.E11]PMM73760.1 hypothetical protein BCT48_03890 [Vibrio sp. 10N.261.46.F12]PMM87297.1 hypothetical protein BCT46_06790 [Vibrio sp. 10N.261.46.E8]PMN35209.1 hypothetical protein BCT34_00205 [Vibrio sp. 10N.261.45.E2]PMN49351.1 hypothetical protein BCT32_06655 [Vibrio sp. 10N.261.45.E11]PMN86713.1 